jgi:hypothetical protein
MQHMVCMCVCVCVYDTRQAFHAWEHKVHKHQVNCMNRHSAAKPRSQITYTSVIPSCSMIGHSYLISISFTKCRSILISHIYPTLYIWSMCVCVCQVKTVLWMNDSTGHSYHSDIPLCIAVPIGIHTYMHNMWYESVWEFTYYALRSHIWYVWYVCVMYG